MTKVYIYKILIVSSNQGSTNQNNFQNDNYKNKTSENNCCRVCGQTLSIPCSLLLEMQTATATLEISVESSLKAKNKSVT